MEFNRFDIVQAHYFYCINYHGGMNCPLYARLCKIMSYYKPSIFDQKFSSLTENGKEIYEQLVDCGPVLFKMEEN